LPAEEVAAETTAPFADEPIEKLDLSVRSLNCLKREGVHTIADLLNYSLEDLMDIRNFGEKSVIEVKDKIESMGLSLKDGGNAPRTGDRPGGYTRIMKLGPRRGDATPMAIIELVDAPHHERHETGAAPKVDEPGRRRLRRRRGTEATAESEETEASIEAETEI